MPKDQTQPSINQSLRKYNRESGKKTLILVATLIILIVVFTVLSLIMLTKPKVLTSSIEQQPTPTPLRK